MSNLLTKISETRTNGRAWRRPAARHPSHIDKWRESLNRDVLRQLGHAGPQD
jgi:hypothetical protein